MVELPSWYSSFSSIITVTVLVAFAVALVSLIGLLLRWRTQFRRRHLLRLLSSLTTIAVLVATKWTVQEYVLLPTISRQSTATTSIELVEMAATTSILHLGDVAPSFAVTTAAGDEFSLPANGQVVLINFFATWCGPCKVELPHIEEIWNRYQYEKNFRLLVIGREESLETVVEYQKENSFSFPIAADPDRQIYSLFAEELIPRTIVVSPDGRIVYSNAGFVEEELGKLNDVLASQIKSVR